MYRLLLLSVISIALATCSRPDASPNAVTDMGGVTVMTFNVENLFDTADDEDKDDHTYLPRSVKDDPTHISRCAPITVKRWRHECLELDWNEQVLDFKLSQLAGVILQVNGGRGPDIISLQEIENAAVLSRLSREYLESAGYGEAILIEGRDRRGIDVAFLSRLPLVASPVLHAFDASDFAERQTDTRGVLEATFELPDGSRLTGLSAHFPAPFHPIEMRELAYEHLNSLRSNIPLHHHVFAAGDFNTPLREMTETTILDDHVRPFWAIAHEIDCSGCKGTHYWSPAKSWSFLDMIFYSQSAHAESTWRIKAGGVFIIDDFPDQLNNDGTVRRFNPEAMRGVSDHLPMVMTLERAAEK